MNERAQFQGARNLALVFIAESGEPGRPGHTTPDGGDYTVWQTNGAFIAAL